MKASPTLSVCVVIPHYGDAAPTIRLVEQLRGRANRIIVSDDCSPTPFPQIEGIEVIRRTTNGGFGQAVNSGVEAAQEDMVLILNSDLDVGPSFVPELLAAAAPYQPCVAGPAIVSPQAQTVESARRFPTVSHQVVEWLSPLARFRHTDWWHRAVGHDLVSLRQSGPTHADWLVGAALLVPVAEFRAIDGFDPRFFMNAEEIDLQRRLRVQGIPSVYVPTVHVVHEGGGSSDSTKRREWLVDARWRYAAKWGGVTRLRAGLLAATVANLAWNTARRLRGAPVAPLRVAREEWRLATMHVTAGRVA